MQKKLVLSIITLCMCISLFGCSSSKEKTNEEMATSTGVSSSIDTSYHKEYVRNYMPENNEEYPSQNYFKIAVIPDVNYDLIRDFDFSKNGTLEGESWEQFRDVIAAYAKTYEGEATAISLSFKNSPYKMSCIGIGDDYSTWTIACGTKAWETGVVSTSQEEYLDGVITVSEDGKTAEFTVQNNIFRSRYDLTQCLPECFNSETTSIVQIGDYYIIRINPEEKIYSKDDAITYTKQVSSYFKNTEIERAKPGHVIFSFVNGYTRTNQNETIYQINYSTCINNTEGELACEPAVGTYNFEKDWAWDVVASKG